MLHAELSGDLLGDRSGVDDIHQEGRRIRAIELEHLPLSARCGADDTDRAVFQQQQPWLSQRGLQLGEIMDDMVRHGADFGMV